MPDQIKLSGKRAHVVAIWDIWTRLFHWSFAIAVAFLLFSGETGFQFYEWHRLVGEFVLLLLVFRIIWGFIGSTNVRFAALLHSPKQAIEHLLQVFKRDVKDERGHNAAGSLAILLMLFLLTVQAVTGLFIADEDELVEGAFYGQFGSDLSYWLYRIHSQNAEILMVLVFIHVAMILVYLLLAGKNLVKPMISGHMQWEGSNSDADQTEAANNTHPPAVRFQHWWIGAICFTLASLAIGWLLGWSL